MCLGIPGKVVETYREHDVLMGGRIRRRLQARVPGPRARGPARPIRDRARRVRLASHRRAEAEQVFEFLGQMNELDELSIERR